MDLVIISGRSGSGKSSALHILEDIGYNCIDNLPVSLVPALLAQVKLHGDNSQKFAIGIDIRSAWKDLDQLPTLVQTIRDSEKRCLLLYLDSRKPYLIKRFSETRRKHPLSNSDTDLIEAIDKEKTLLQPVIDAADQIIDTSHMSLHQLRDAVKKLFIETDDSAMAVQFQSFGFKYGLPADADLVFDVRCLPNPHWVSELRSQTGLDNGVIEFLSQEADVEAMFNDIRQHLENWLPKYQDNNRSYITIAIGCTGGQHRSVYLSQRLCEYFCQEQTNVQVRHRELEKKI